jgi:hypothetical protein
MKGKGTVQRANQKQRNALLVKNGRNTPMKFSFSLREHCKAVNTMHGQKPSSHMPHEGVPAYGRRYAACSWPGPHAPAGDGLAWRFQSLT